MTRLGSLIMLGVLCFSCADEQQGPLLDPPPDPPLGAPLDPPLNPPLDPPLDAIRNAVRLSNAISSASGVYLGEGLVLTNWHVCTNDRTVLTYNAATQVQPAYREGTPLDGSRCEDGANSGYCYPNSMRGDVDFAGEAVQPHTLGGLGPDVLAPSFGGPVLFAQKALDLCIIQLADQAVRRAPVDLASLSVDQDEVQLGQEVVVAGFPLGVDDTVAETCHVIATPALMSDPDAVHPSDSVVPSFTIDCKTVQHGSSGSPVFDATTGALLGLAWTASCAQLGECKPPGYVTAASAWLNQGDRPATEYSQLQDVLDRFSAP